MNHFKVKAFLREFHWLAGLLEDMGYADFAEEYSSRHNAPRTDTLLMDAIEEVKVKRIDEDFLNTVPTYIGATGSMVGIADSTRIFLLDRDGNIIEEPNQAKDITHNEAHHDDEDEPGESVGEALSHVENPDAAIFAVCVKTGYKIHDHYSTGGFSVTVYKPPKGFSLKQWVEEQIKRASQILAAEIAEIDAEA